MSTVACDISEFQPVVNDSYPHRWLTFRVCDGDYLDHNVTANLAWCKAALAAGKLDGYTVYVVYRPGMNSTILGHLDGAGIPNDCWVMVDVESWGSQITGDHSTEINALCSALAKRQGDQSRVWGYANLNDYRTVWPNRPAWLGLVVASYGGQQPTSPGPGPLVGWQYTDGQYSEPNLPSSSAPFGACDHNLLFMEADMPLSDTDVQKVADAVWAKLRPVFTDDAGRQFRVETLAGEALGKALSGLPAQIAAKVPGLTVQQVQAALDAELAKITLKVGS